MVGTNLEPLRHEFDMLDTDDDVDPGNSTGRGKKRKTWKVPT